MSRGWRSRHASSVELALGANPHPSVQHVRRLAGSALVCVRVVGRPDELELEPVRVLEEDRVVALAVLGEAAWGVRDRRPELTLVVGGTIEVRARRHLEAEVV
jgi:hypothetical protein